MAYANYLASVPEHQISQMAAQPSKFLVPHKVEVVSHVVASWITVQPLGKLLGQALDGGRILTVSLWHPLRRPLYHPPEAASALFGELAREWQRSLIEHRPSESDWYRIEIEKVLSVFSDAKEHGLCVVSALGRPGDRERADRVQILFEWGRRT
jgi:hypothetical protein